MSKNEPRNYWNTVGSKLENFPTNPRLESIPNFTKSGKILNEPKDPWWINSKKDNYCFWSYVRKHSNKNGYMEPLLQSEIAKLFGCSSTKIHFILKEALEELKNDDNIELLEKIFHNDN